MAKHNCPDCHCEETRCEISHCTHPGYGYEFCCRCDYQHSFEAGWYGNDSIDTTSWPPPGCKLQVLVG
jgi:hypothetical protein